MTIEELNALSDEELMEVYKYTPEVIRGHFDELDDYRLHYIAVTEVNLILSQLPAEYTRI